MKSCQSLVSLIMLAIWLPFASFALAQVDGISTFAVTTCDGHEVDVHITFTVYDEIPDDITSWIVVREVVGSCVDNEDVGEVQTLPRDIGEHDFVVHDVLTIPGKAVYYIFAIDTAGTRYWVPWPQRTHFTQADCYQGVAARGTVVMMPGGWPHLEVCPEECWWELSYFDNSFPMDQEWPPEGAIVDIYGDLVAGMEGPYVDADLWLPSAVGCTSVDLDDLQWGSLKALYR
jgi:hypothetical protein